MKRQFCDRCDKDITDAEAVAEVSLIRKAHDGGGGDIDDTWDLCATCVEALEAFIEPPPAVSKEVDPRD